MCACRRIEELANRIRSMIHHPNSNNFESERSAISKYLESTNLCDDLRQTWVLKGISDRVIGTPALTRTPGTTDVEP
jgi:hypothetical protein